MARDALRDFMIPDSEDISLEIVSRMLKLDDDTRAEFLRAPLLAPESAALAYSLAEGVAADLAPKKVTQEFIAPRSIGEPKAFW